MKQVKQQNDPLWRNGQIPTSRDQQQEPEHNEPLIEARKQNEHSRQNKRNH